MTALWSLVVLFAAVVGAASGQSANAQSGCEVCASTGDCSRAYRGEQGQFCGNWLDRENNRRPCCCPVNAVCKVSNYACNCGGGSVVGNDGGHGLVWLWWLLGSLGLLLCCCGCCIMAFKKSKERDPDRDIPMATPVTEGGYSQPYGTAPSAPAEPMYASASTPSYGRYYGRSGGMGAGTGAALGGTAGLLGGLLLGETLADHGGFGGDAGGFDGGGGGFDGGGTDFAGDF